MKFFKAYEKIKTTLFDRFHIRFNTGDEWVMSHNANSRQGVCYYNGLFSFSIPCEACEVPYDELPIGIKNQIESLTEE